MDWSHKKIIHAKFGQNLPAVLEMSFEAIVNDG